MLFGIIQGRDGDAWDWYGNIRYDKSGQIIHLLGK